MDLSLSDNFKPVKDYTLKNIRSFSELMECYLNSGGFQSAELGRAERILEEMYKDSECTKFLAFTGNLIATGLRGVISEMILEGLVDVVITTGGAIDHDIARSFGGVYQQGSFLLSDVELREKNYHRLGNVVIPLESYGPTVERFLRSFLENKKISSPISPSELLYEIGGLIKDNNSILRACYLRKVPIISPGILDSAFGTVLMYHYQKEKFTLDLLKDMKLISDIVFEKKRTGALILGGGISKHHTLWWNQFKDGLDYVIAVTTAQEYDGSLSGAKISEAVSWHKVKPEAKVVTVFGDVTIILPILLVTFYERMRTI